MRVPPDTFISKHVSHLTMTVEELPTFTAQQTFVKGMRRKHQLNKVQAGEFLAWHPSPCTQWAIPQVSGESAGYVESPFERAPSAPVT